MRIIKPSFEITDDIDGAAMLKRIERTARVCYKSEDRIAEGTAEKFIANILKRGHESVIEHEKITVRITCDRGVSHEIVRHRIASYSQESTRYCSYNKDKFGGEITFIRPCFWDSEPEKYALWVKTMEEIEKSYMKLIDMGASPEEARCVLPNSLKTEIVVTMNLREWRHFFKLRTAERAHPQMREIAVPMLKEFQSRVPLMFDDIEVK